MVRKIILGSILLMSYACISSIHHKKYLFPQKELGKNNHTFKTDGYYYRILNDTMYYKNHLKRDGTYDKETSFYYQLKFLRCLFFSEDGYVIERDFTTSYVYNLDSVKYYNENLFELFEKKLSRNKYVEGFIKKSNNWFTKSKAEVWDNGIYSIKQDSIRMQIYVNALGDYYLIEYHGILEGEKIKFVKEFSYGNKKWHSDTLEYQFKKYNIGHIVNYMKENKTKFWRK